MNKPYNEKIQSLKNNSKEKQNVYQLFSYCQSYFIAIL